MERDVDRAGGQAWGSLEAQQAHCTQVGAVPRDKHVPYPRLDLTQTAPPTGLWEANCPTPSLGQHGAI